MEFLQNAEPFLRSFWYIAIFVTIIFLLQSFASFADHDSSSHDGDFSVLDLFTFKNLINFLLGFSWSGIAFYSKIESKSVLLIIATLIGLSFVFAFFYIMSKFLKLEEDNTFTIDQTIHQTGTVYLRIPGNKTGRGKVHISINGSLKELDAMTYEDQIETGSNVKVMSVENNDLLIVEKL